MTEQINHLKNQLIELDYELAKIKADKLRAEKEYKKILDKVLDIRKYIDELEKVENATIRITDHAILRYMERFQKFDPEPIKQVILDKINLDDLKTLGGTARIKIDNMRIVLDNYTVITVTEL